jgi:GTPase SAR1 family protein
MYSSPEIKVFLIGNKCDLTETRQVTYEEGLKFQQESKIDYFTETSAKIKHNTAEAFENCAKLLYSEYLKLKEQFGSSEQVGSYTSYDTRNSAYSFKLGMKIRSKDNLNGNKENKDIRESNEVLDKASNQGCRC